MMNKNELPLISVIVPIYNVEKYLKRCVDSILSQTYKNLEILLIDDGSPDACGMICDQYAKKDFRIKVIHKKNGGLSDARNAGLEMASGDYITCIDSDDWISNYYVSNLYKAIVKDDADVSISGFVCAYEDKMEQLNKVLTVDTLETYKCLSSHDCIERMLYQNEVEVSAWGKLYKKHIIQDLRYPVGKLYEDIPVTYECMKQSKKVAVVNNIDYFYFQRKNSIQNEKFSLRKLDGIKHCREMMENVKQDYPDLGVAAESRYFSTVCNILFQIKEHEFTKERDLLWNEILKYRKHVLIDKKARKKNRMAALISYMGFYVTTHLYHLVQRRG